MEVKGRLVYPTGAASLRVKTGRPWEKGKEVILVRVAEERQRVNGGETGAAAEG